MKNGVNDEEIVENKAFVKDLMPSNQMMQVE